MPRATGSSPRWGCWPGIHTRSTEVHRPYEPVFRTLDRGVLLGRLLALGFDPPPLLATACRARSSRSAAMRFNNSDAGSSFGSCGTSWPVKACRRMDCRYDCEFCSLVSRSASM